MSREILFKAKRKDWMELPKEQWWVEGFPFKQLLDGENVWCIGTSPLSANDYSEIVGRNKFWCEIDPETLCQYTGLTDKNGRKIWENDILVEKHRGRIHYIFKVVWDAEEGSWMCESKFGSKYGIGIINSSEFEKNGDIFDNPELLKDE